MDHYVTGGAIRALREKLGMTQAELAKRLCVSDKTVSKWETGKGLPDIVLLEPLAKALGVSVPELISGRPVVNANRASNLLKARFSVCPVCGNAVISKGDAMISCCGVALPALEAEDADAEHAVAVERVEDEYFVTSAHAMTKEHYLSFFAYVTQDRIEFKALYPEGSAEARFFMRGAGWLVYYCNRHGLFRRRLERMPKT